jgi:hypothetical protein
LERLGAGFLANYLQKAEPPILSAPNCLIISFPPHLNHERDYCSEPTRLARVEELLLNITGEAWRLEVELTEPDCLSSNAGTIVEPGPVIHDGLHFRSKTETRIYDVLKARKVLFFPNPAAVLGGDGRKKEPDFLICLDGKWGILEVMGDPYHNGLTAVADHDRARIFKDYGILVIEFYDAARCYNNPEAVVDDFLRRLQKLQ